MTQVPTFSIRDREALADSIRRAWFGVPEDQFFKLAPTRELHVKYDGPDRVLFSLESRAGEDISKTERKSTEEQLAILLHELFDEELSVEFTENEAKDCCYSFSFSFTDVDIEMVFPHREPYT